MNEPNINQSMSSMDSDVDDSDRSLRDFLHTLRRRTKLFSVIAAVLVAVVLLVATALPSIYRSSAIVLIEQQEIPTELVQSTITSYADQRIQTISQRVMTTSNLTDIMDQYGLYSDEREKEPTSAILERMRDDIQLEMISSEVIDPRSGRPTEATIAFELSYENRSPQLAQRVTNELTNLYLSENIKNRTEMATETTTFLEDEAEELAAQVSEMESALAAFKEEHADSLPDMSELNLQIRERLTRELRNVEGQLRSLDERIIYLKSEKAQISPRDSVYGEDGKRLLGPADRLRLLETELIAARGRYSSDHPTVKQLEREIRALRQNIGSGDRRGALLDRRTELQTDLATLRDRYGPTHPDVVSMENELESVNAMLRESGGEEPQIEDVPPDNPAYLQIESQLQAALSERESLQEIRNELKSRIERVETALRGTPQVEREYRSLLRGYENAMAKFQEVKSKQLEAQLGESLEQERKGERFTLIEPPLLPEEPVKPNRLAIVLIGMLLSVGTGIACVMVADSLDESITGPKDISRYLQAPPLAVIPYISTEADIQQQRTRIFAGLTIVLGIGIGGGAFIHFAVLPLDVLWLSIARRFSL